MKKQHTTAAFFALTAALLLSPLAAASLPAISASEPESMTRKLKLEVLRTLPEPVIGKDTPGAEAIRGGFEGGTTVKVKIGDKTQYHLFSSGMENLDWSKFHLEHWISDDGNRFQRKDVLLDDYTDKETGLKHLFLSPYPFFSKSDNRWYMIFFEYVVEGSWSGQCGTMWCAPCKRTSIEGIDGPWEFEKRYVIVPKRCAPINNVVPVSTSLSMPFQVQDGRWAVMVSTDYFEKGTQWWQTGWWRGAWAIRTPHLLVDEGDGTYTVFFTGSTTANHFAGFRAMGKTTVRLIEE